MQQRLPQEREKLLARIPEWSDGGKAKVEQKEVFEYLTNEGYQQHEIVALIHSGPALAMAVKAMRYDAAKSKSQTIKQKLVTIPKKVLKPGPKPAAAAKPNGADFADTVSVLYGKPAQTQGR
jgi:hypothetical protein